MGVFDRINIFNRNRTIMKVIEDMSGKDIPEGGITDMAVFDDLESDLKGKEGAYASIISELRNTTRDRKKRYESYKKAMKDPIIGQAVEMVADDSTQFDIDRERTI